MRIVLFCYFLFTASDVVTKLVDPLPQNKAVAEGATRVALNCTSTNGWGFISWGVFPVGGSTSSIISVGSNVDAPYRDTYSVSNAGDLTSTLTIIETVNESLAGTYFCNEGVATASAQLIVYNSDPVCTTNVSSVLYQGQTVQMSCSFSYTANSSYIGVRMVWSKENPVSTVFSHPPVITTTGSRTTAVSTFTQTVGYSSPFPVYRCRTLSRLTAITGTSAINHPDYTKTTQLYNSPIDVLYFNPNCSIKGANPGDRILFGSTISCQADANPPPSYRWSNGTDATLSSASSVTIMNDGEYRYICTASNAAGSCTQSITLTTYTTTAPPTTSTTTTVTPPTTSTPSITPSADQSLSSGNKVIIGVVVGVGGFLLLVAIIIIVCCFMKNKRGGDRQKPESLSAPGPNQQTSTQTNFENVVTYEKPTDSPAQRAQIYASLQPPEQEENPVMHVEPYETLTDRTEQPHEYDRLRFPLK